MTAILVIQDDIPLVRLAHWFLSEAGYEVMIVASTEIAAVLGSPDCPTIMVCNTPHTADERQAHFDSWRALRPGMRVVDLHPWILGGPASPADASVELPMHADNLIEAVRRLETP